MHLQPNLTFSRRYAVNPFLLTAHFAMLAAVAELSVLAVRTFVFGRWAHTDARILWLSPLSWVLLTFPVALVAWGGARWLRRPYGPFVAAFLPALVCSFGVAFLFHPRLHRVAIVLLSIGAAVQIARLVVRQSAGYQRFARRSLLALTLLVVGAFAWQTIQAAVRQRRPAVSQARADAPNVLLLVLDTVRAISTSLHGALRPTTPELESFARQGARFTSAYAPSPWTLPSHASMFTGQYPHEMSVGFMTPLSRDLPVLAEALAGQGYATAGFVANVLFAGRETGLARGFDHYEDAVVSFAEIALSSSIGRFTITNPRIRALSGKHDVPGRRSATDIVDAFLSWHARSGRQPFFAFLNLYDAHEPYLPPEPFGSRFAPSGTKRDLSQIQMLSRRDAARIGKPRMDSLQREAELRAYEGGIAYMDAEIGRLVRALRQRGVLDNTIVIVTSDHGEMFGEHELFGHAQALYRPVLHVPLVVVHPPSVPLGATIESPVTLRDLAATVLDLTAVSHRVTLPGRSWRVLWSGPEGEKPSPAVASVEPAPNQTERYLTAPFPMRSVLTQRWNFIRSSNGSEELYDLFADPEERVDVSQAPAYRDTLGALRSVLEGLRAWR